LRELDSFCVFFDTVVVGVAQVTVETLHDRTGEAKPVRFRHLVRTNRRTDDRTGVVAIHQFPPFQQLDLAVVVDVDPRLVPPQIPHLLQVDRCARAAIVQFPDLDARKVDDVEIGLDEVESDRDVTRLDLLSARAPSVLVDEDRKLAEAQLELFGVVRDLQYRQRERPHLVTLDGVLQVGVRAVDELLGPEAIHVDLEELVRAHDEGVLGEESAAQGLRRVHDPQRDKVVAVEVVLDDHQLLGGGGAEHLVFGEGRGVEVVEAGQVLDGDVLVGQGGFGAGGALRQVDQVVQVAGDEHAAVADDHHHHVRFGDDADVMDFGGAIDVEERVVVVRVEALVGAQHFDVFADVEDAVHVQVFRN
jgi:hypothetical protein